MLFSNILAISSADPLDLAPLIYGFAVMVGVFSAFVGFWRGFMRQTVRTVTVIIAAIISYALSYFIFDGIIKYVDGKSAEEIRLMLINSGLIPGGAQEWISSLDAHSLKLFLSVPTALFILPVIYVLCFILVSGILLPLHKFISALCGFKARRSTLGSRLLGFLLGAVQGVAAAGIILMPVIGVSSLAEESAAALNEYAPEDSFTETCNEVYGAYARSVSENPVTVAYGALGIESLYERIATVNIEGKEIRMTELFPDAIILTSDAMKLGGCNPKSLTLENEAQIISMLERIEKNPLFSDILASAIRSASFAYKDGTFPKKPPEPFDTLISSSIEIFHTVSTETLSGDLRSLSDIYFVLSRGGVLTSFYDGDDSVRAAMTAKDSEGKTTADKILEIAKANERMTPLLKAVAQLSVTVMKGGTGIGDEAPELYENIKAGINADILTRNEADYESREEYVSDISSALDATLTENGVSLDAEALGVMSEFIADNFGEVNELTDAEACEIIFSYYDACKAAEEQ